MAISFVRLVNLVSYRNVKKGGKVISSIFCLEEEEEEGEIPFVVIGWQRNPA
jgi:hypothetical protein